MLDKRRFILPNNMLFTLAMNPPADMKSLKSILKRTPTSLQDRLIGLLNVIREGVESGLTSGPNFGEQELVDSKCATDSKMTGPVKIIDRGVCDNLLSLLSVIQYRRRYPRQNFHDTYCRTDIPDSK